MINPALLKSFPMALNIAKGARVGLPSQIIGKTLPTQLARRLLESAAAKKAAAAKKNEKPKIDYKNQPFNPQMEAVRVAALKQNPVYKKAYEKIEADQKAKREKETNSNLVKIGSLAAAALTAGLLLFSGD